LVELFEEGIEGHRVGRPFRAWGMWGALVLGRCPRLSWNAPLVLIGMQVAPLALEMSCSNAPKGQSTVARGNAPGLGLKKIPEP
jgi:hypothetical protein